MFSIKEDTKITRVSNASGASTSDVVCTAVDMKGFDSCTFVASFGAITSGCEASVKARQSTAANMANPADLLGTSIAVADDDDDQCVVLEIHKPRERYLQCVLLRETQTAVVDGVIAIQSNAAETPTTHDSTTVVDAELHHAPAEGTA